MRNKLITTIVILASSPALAQLPDPTTTDPMADPAVSADATVQGEATVPTPATAAVSGGISTTGDYGVGVETTLGSLAGITGRYQMSDILGLYGVLRVVVSNEDIITDTYGLGVGGMYRMKTFDNGAIGLVGGLDIRRASAGSTSATSFAIGGGVAVEWFVDPRLSLHAQAGLALAYTSQTASFAMMDIESSGLTIQIGGDALASFGATLWFR